MSFRPRLCIGLACFQDFLDSFSKSWEIVLPRLPNLGDSLRDSYISTKLRLVDLLDEGLLVIRSYIASVLILGLVLQAVIQPSEYDAFLLLFVIVFQILCLGYKVVVQALYSIYSVATLIAIPTQHAVMLSYDLRPALVQVYTSIVGFLLEWMAYRPVQSFLEQRRRYFYKVAKVIQPLTQGIRSRVFRLLLIVDNEVKC